MSGYEKVSFLKFEAAGESWYVTKWRVSETPGHSWVEVEEVRKNGQEDSHREGRVCVETGEWIWGGLSMYPGEKFAIVDYLRANPLPGEGE